MPRKAMTKSTSKTEEVKTEEVKQTVSKPEPKKFNPNDGIRCRSVTHGILFVDGLATNMKYTFEQICFYGDNWQGEINVPESAKLRKQILFYDWQSRFLPFGYSAFHIEKYCRKATSW